MTTAKMQMPTQSDAEPWLANKRWASGKIPDDLGSTIGFLLFFGIAWNAISWPTFMLALRDHNRAAFVIYVAALFPLVGIGFVIAVLVNLWRRMKYGRSVLELETLPGVIGGWLAGTIRTPVMLDAAESVHLLIQCVRRESSGSGDSRHTSEFVLWSDEQLLTPRLPRDGATGFSIPVAFQISPDALPTSAAATSGTRRNSEVLWRLRASASTPGLDYAVTFGVPVYAVAATTARTATPKTEAVAAKFRLPARPAAQRAADARIGFSRDTAGRVKFDFPAARNAKAATMITFFGLLFAGAAAGFLYADGGLFFPIVFGGVGALILLGASRMWLLGRSVIVNQGSVEIRWRMAGLGGSRAIAKESIQAVNYDTNTQVGSTPYYRVRLDVSGGNSVVVGAGLLQADAKWIAAETSAALGIESAGA